MSDHNTKLKASYSEEYSDVTFRFESGNLITMSLSNLYQIHFFMSEGKLPLLIEQGYLEVDMSTSRDEYVKPIQEKEASSTFNFVNREGTWEEFSSFPCAVESTSPMYNSNTGNKKSNENKVKIESNESKAKVDSVENGTFKGIETTTLLGINTSVIVWNPIFFPDGKIAIFKKHILKIWSAEGGSPITSIKNHDITGIFDCLTNNIILVRNNVMNLCTWNIIDNIITEFDTEEVGDCQIIGDRIISKGMKCGLKVWDLKFKLLIVLPTIIVTNYTLITSGLMVIACKNSPCENGILLIYDINIHVRRDITQSHSCEVDKIYALSSGRIVTSYVNITKVWNVHTLQCVYTFEGQLGNNLTIILGDRLVTKDAADLKVWSLVDGKKIATIKTNIWIHVMYKLTDNKIIIANTIGENSIEVWNIDTGLCECVYNKEITEMCMTKDGRVYVLSPEGLKILS